MINAEELNESVRQSSYKYMTDEEKEEATKIAGHLAANYTNAVWDMSSGRFFSSEDIYNIQERYDKVKLHVVEMYERSLNDRVLKFFKLKRKKKDEKITLNDVTDIIKYKFYTKPKRKIACFMWDKPYDIYNLVNRR